MKTLNIGNKIIGGEEPAFIIAEIGINHNGDMKNVFKLIDLAKDTGCDAVKFQKRTPELAVPKDQWDVTKDTPWGLISYIDYKNRIELSVEQYKEIDKYCSKKEILWFASCWDEKAVDDIASVNAQCFKSASASLTDTKRINKMLSFGVPIIMSTGMSTMDEINSSLQLFENRTIGLLHATSSYPCEYDELNLKMIATLKQKFPEHVIGYSGHESGLVTSAVAIAFGAKIVERHITLDRAMWGTDQAASLGPNGLRTMVSHIRTVEKSIGDGVKKVYDSEIPIREKLRRAN